MALGRSEPYDFAVLSKMIPSCAGIVTELTRLPSFKVGSCVPLSFLKTP